jgi:hypothetical protein
MHSVDQLSKYPSRNLYISAQRREKGDDTNVLFKCNSCKTMNIPKADLIGEKCPLCGAPVVEQCPKDKRCKCGEEVHGGIVFCPECGNTICPGCGSHDVLAISRITGYLQDVGGWNAGKAQELKDRRRTDVSGVSYEHPYGGTTKG